MKKIFFFLILVSLFLFSACATKPPKPCTSTIEVCAESALLPNEYCPQRIAVTFPCSQEPKTACAIHKEPIPQCQHPWPETRKLLCWSGTFFTGLCGTLEFFDEQKLKSLYNEMAKDGVNAIREFAFWLDENPESPWCQKAILPFRREQSTGASLKMRLDIETKKIVLPKWEWRKRTEINKNLMIAGNIEYRLNEPNQEYYDQLHRRLTLAFDRKITTIISLLDSCSADFLRHDPHYWEYVEHLVGQVKPYFPYVIVEAVNEVNGFSVDDAYQFQKQTVSKLKELGIPQEHIQVTWFDSSDLLTLIESDLGEKGLCSWHQVGSLETMEWFHSGVRQEKFIPAGSYGSSDGGDWLGKAQGLKCFGHDEWTRKPSAEQLEKMVEFTLKNGGRGIDHLSASGCQNCDTWSLAEAIETGNEERRAIKKGYDKLIN